MNVLNIGNIAIQKVDEFAQPFLMPVDALFPSITASDFHALRPGLHPRSIHPLDNSIYLSTHSYLVKIGDRNILVDTCVGNCKPRTGDLSVLNMLTSDYLGNLARAGARPEEIDIVLCTHLHADHVGWNTKLEDGRWVPTFPNARYLISRADIDFYGALSPESPRYCEWHESYQDSVLPILHSGQADLISVGGDGHEIMGGVWLEAAPGHTPGSMMMHARSGAEHALFSADVFHHPLQVHQPRFGVVSDIDPALALEQRLRLIDRYANSGTTILAAHFPDPTAGRIERDGTISRFAYIE